MANAELVLDLQCRRPVKTATLDVDATVIPCEKRAAKRAYNGNRGDQPVLALGAEQDVIVTDEFRDGNVPAGSGNLRGQCPEICVREAVSHRLRPSAR